MTRFAKLAAAAAIATYVLIVAGGLVRATDSGLGCPDWPLCFGAWVPPPELHAWIEHTHRLIAAFAVGPLVGAVALITVLTDRRRDRPLLVAAVVAGVLVIVQAVLGGIVVLQQLRPIFVSAHLAMALTVLAMTIVIADRAASGPMPARRGAMPLGLIGLAAGLTFAQMVLGSWVTGHGAGLAYPDFPLMDGSLWPAVASYTEAVQLAHRVLAFGVAVAVLWMAFSVWRATPSPWPRRLAATAAVLIGVQILLGGANVWSRLSAVFVVPHLAVGAALFAVLVWLLLTALREPEGVLESGAIRPAGGGTPGEPRADSPAMQTFRAYLALTKPRIIELLLVTTVPSMVLAQRGLPDPWLVLAVVFGGSLAAGGANAINQFVDRDIDDVMRRTRHRPLPRHAIAPQNALRFGIALSVISFAWLTLTVNLLSAVLATSAILFYVFVYTLWLKRSTPQAVVIGGAAGCVPVLVGWAAVTGRVEIPALVLFAIVFYWTPPHFWALALRFRGDYEAARVPMLPVVRGEDETARQIVLYSLLLVAVSLLLFPAARMGIIYLVAAVVLGAAFVWYALRVRRNLADGRAAIRLFRFSSGYLTLLFAAVAVDSLLFVPVA
ncbi:MAG TPA: heme o synthase [candidate division Zixibacteria bacterium]|nr:heme o synthase [candidate division Zixibacteria bacterium]